MTRSTERPHLYFSFSILFPICAEFDLSIFNLHSIIATLGRIVLVYAYAYGVEGNEKSISKRRQEQRYQGIRAQSIRI